MRCPLAWKGKLSPNQRHPLVRAPTNPVAAIAVVEQLHLNRHLRHAHVPLRPEAPAQVVRQPDASPRGGDRQLRRPLLRHAERRDGAPREADAGVGDHGLAARGAPVREDARVLDPRRQAEPRRDRAGADDRGAVQALDGGDVHRELGHASSCCRCAPGWRRLRAPS